MIASLLFSLVPTLACPVPLAPAPAIAVQSGDKKAEYEKRLAEAGKDTDKLWALYDWCEAFGLKREQRKLCLKIIRVDPDHKKAREALGHTYYDGQWFKSERELEKYKQEEAERVAKEKGLVRFKGEWVDPADVPYLERGMVRSRDGGWITRDEAKKIEEGWSRQDLEWIAPGEVGEMERGLWKCGDRWLPLAEANAYHAEVERWWRIPSDHFVLHTTCDRATAMKALDEMEVAFRDLVEVYGVAPSEPLHAAILRSIDQYNAFSQADLIGTSGLYGTYFALHWRDIEPRTFHGGGVGYWDDSSEASSRFGINFARGAAGFAFGHGVDPSTKAVNAFLKSKTAEFDIQEYLEGKRLPAWFHTGAAMYASRYWTDPTPGADADRMRKWSASNIARAGGLDPLDRIFAFELDLGTDEGKNDAARMSNEAGLLVAFVLHGGVPAVEEAHAALADEMQKGGKKVAEKMAALEAAIRAHEAELKAFGGF